MDADGSVAQRDRPALGLIACEQAGAGPARAYGGELPAEVHDVADAGVHAEAGERGEEVGGVAGEEDARRLVALRDEGLTAGPRSAGKDLEFGVAAHRTLPEHPAHDVGRCERLPVDVGRHLVMHDPVLGPVLRVHEAAVLGIDDPGDDCRRAAAVGDQAGCADVVGQHGAAHERAWRAAVLAGHGDAELAADGAARAVGGDHEACGDGVTCAIADILDQRLDVVGVLRERHEAPAETHVDAGMSLGVRLQDRLEPDLADGVQRFRRRQVGAGLSGPDARMRPCHARDLEAAVARDVGVLAADSRRANPPRGYRRRRRAGGTAPSIARWWRCTSGASPSSRFSATRIAGTPRWPSSIAADRPTGPPPTIRTKVSSPVMRCSSQADAFG